jgi:hypothetical protein
VFIIALRKIAPCVIGQDPAVVIGGRRDHAISDLRDLPHR